MKDDYVAQLMNECDVFIAAEVWMRKEGLPAAKINGWNLWASLYPTAMRGITYGGLLVYARTTVPLKMLSIKEEAWETLAWYKVGDTIYGTAYLPPNNSSFLTHWTIEPIELLLQDINTYASQYPEAAFIILGDLNARAAVGTDTVTSTRGRFLRATLPDNWTIAADRATHISSDLRSLSTLDYVIRCPKAQTRSTTAVGPFSGLSDHCWIKVTSQSRYDPPPEIEPLPHAKPPSLPATQADEEEAALLAKHPTEKDPTEIPPYFHPDTTDVHNLRKQAERAQETLRMDPGNRQLHATTRSLQNRLTAARRRHQAARRTHRARYLATLPPAQWWKHANELLRSKDGKEISIPGPVITEHFRTLLRMENVQIPLPPPEGVPLRQFEEDFTEEEVRTMVAKLKKSSAGEDRVTCQDIRSIPTPELTKHINHILETGDPPSSWSRMILVAIPKPGLAANTPSNLRGIALQSAFRKVFTLLVMQRLFETVEPSLPATQSGFRPGRRTTDNLFVLRTLHEKAVEQNENLFLAQIDLRRAFDSVSRPKLFAQLYSRGIFGRVITALRITYERQEVFVKANKRFSQAIQANVGVPQGDPLSPLLFILYMADLRLQHQDDPTIGSLSVPYLALADDFTLTSQTREGLQWKLAELHKTCEALELHINPNKCSIAAMGQLAGREEIGIFKIKESIIPRTSTIVINGYSMNEENLKGGWDSDTHALVRLKKAASAFRVVKALRHELGLTTPKDLLRTYRTLVESKLAYAKEICFDTSPKTTALLLRTQKSDVRYICGVHCRAMTGILLRDCAILDSTRQTLLITIKYLQYLAESNPLTPAREALNEQFNLRFGWFERLRVNMNAIGFPLDRHFDPRSLVKLVEGLLWQAQQLELLTEIEQTSRMKVWSGKTDLLEPPKPKKPAIYLSLPRPLARACARLRTSSHNMAIERLRIGNRRKSRHLRICTHCTVVEDEEHVLQSCPLFNAIRPGNITNLLYRCLECKTISIAVFIHKTLQAIDLRYIN